MEEFGTRVATAADQMLTGFVLTEKTCQFCASVDRELVDIFVALAALAPPPYAPLIDDDNDDDGERETPAECRQLAAPLCSFPTQKRCQVCGPELSVRRFMRTDARWGPQPTERTNMRAIATPFRL